MEAQFPAVSINTTFGPKTTENTVNGIRCLRATVVRHSCKLGGALFLGCIEAGFINKIVILVIHFAKDFYEIIKFCNHFCTALTSEMPFSVLSVFIISGSQDVRTDCVGGNRAISPLALSSSLASTFLLCFA